MPEPVASTPKRRPPGVQFLLKGLAIILPPVLTLVILIWIGRGINDYIIQPIATVVRFGIAELIDHSVPTRDLQRVPNGPPLPYCGTNYLVEPDDVSWVRQVLENAQREAEQGRNVERIYERIADAVYVPLGGSRRAVPYNEYIQVAVRHAPNEVPHTVTGFYMELAEVRNPFGYVGLSVLAVSVAIVVLYYVGRIGTARVGAWAVAKVENVFLNRLPVISNVYSPVKQVTEFLFSERTVQYNRVVAVEYPRRGIWSLGFVTGEGLLQVTAAAGEPMVSVLIPTSPAPFTGFTVCVPRSEVIDLDLTIDQAFQFCISCGVHVPPRQRVTPELLQKELAKRLAAASRPLFPRPSDGDAASASAEPSNGQAPRPDEDASQTSHFRPHPGPEPAGPTDANKKDETD